jgi:hypothetical protein
MYYGNQTNPQRNAGRSLLAHWQAHCGKNQNGEYRANYGEQVIKNISNELSVQQTFIVEINEKIRLAQYEALKAVNASLIKPYWDIGCDISERQGESWGQSIVPVLSAELQKEIRLVSRRDSRS